MRKYITLFVFLTMIWSCDEDNDVTIEDKISGNWKFTHSIVGSLHELSPMGGVTYRFNKDNTFIKNELSPPPSREEGIWSYSKGSEKLNLTFKPVGIGDARSLELTVDKITNKELVLKADYNKVNFLGEFVAFKFMHYLKE